MQKHIRLLLYYNIILLLCVSCFDANNSGDIYKTKSGEHASKSGKFVAKFPIKPAYSILDREFGTEVLQVHSFRTVLGPNKIFAVDYVDYPKTYIDQLSEQEVYKLIKTNYIYQSSGLFELDFEQPIEQHGLKGQYVVLRLKENRLKKNVDGHYLIQIFKRENRIYTISYLGINDSQIGEFLESFRLF